jgi:hypothetical protein
MFPLSCARARPCNGCHTPAHFYWFSICSVWINKNKIEKVKYYNFLLFLGAYKFDISHGPYSRGSVIGWSNMLQEGRGFDSRWGHWIFFNVLNPSSRTMALGSTQLLIEMSIRNISGGKGRPAPKANNLTVIREPIVWRKCGSIDVSQPYGPPRHVTGIALPLLPYMDLIWKSLPPPPHPGSLSQPNCCSKNTTAYALASPAADSVWHLIGLFIIVFMDSMSDIPYHSTSFHPVSFLWWETA